MNDLFNLSVASQFTANLNHLPSVRTQIISQFSGIDWTGREPCIGAVEMRSATAFTVKLNANTVITAEPVDGSFLLRFTGTIAYVIFFAATTLTWFRCEWGIDRKNHNIPTFTAITGTAITVKDDYGVSISGTPTANAFELAEGWYTLTATLAGYVTLTYKFLYLLESTIKVPTQIPV